MGAKASKITRATSTPRKYPTRQPSVQTTPTEVPSSASPAAGSARTLDLKLRSSYDKSDLIKQDAQDPDFQSMLRSVGMVQVPDAARNVRVDMKMSSSLRMLAHRTKLAEEHESNTLDMEKRDQRKWADTHTIRQALQLREMGRPAEKIENELGLERGFMDRMGNKVFLP
ncbi:hypothetical protein RUND412_005019 [Rhizina undulata]